MLSRRSASRPMYLCVAVFFARYWSARHNCMIGLWFFSGQKDKIELYPRRDTHLRAAAPNKMLYLVILRKAPKFNDLWRVIICPCLGCHVWLTYIHAFVSYLADWRTHRHMHRQTHTHTHTQVITIAAVALYTGAQVNVSGMAGVVSVISWPTFVSYLSTQCLEWNNVPP